MGGGGKIVSARTLSQIRDAGISVLTESLGPVDAIRFLQQFDAGSGDYTADRKRILGDPPVSVIVDRIKSRRRPRQ
jgi:hypothetical protein